MQRERSNCRCFVTLRFRVHRVGLILATGHSLLLQACELESTGHVAPPWAACVVIERALVSVPLAQVLLQVLHSPHPETWQGTAWQQQSLDLNASYVLHG